VAIWSAPGSNKVTSAARIAARQRRSAPRSRSYGRPAAHRPADRLGAACPQARRAPTYRARAAATPGGLPPICGSRGAATPRPAGRQAHRARTTNESGPQGRQRADYRPASPNTMAAANPVGAGRFGSMPPPRVGHRACRSPERRCHRTVVAGPQRRQSSAGQAQPGNRRGEGSPLRD
jgi:hypothetical protein